MSDLPDWVKPGAAVAVITSARHTRHDSVKKTTIEKVGKRDIVLANGERFNVNDAWHDGNGERYIQRRSRDAWSASTFLYSIDAERVQKALAWQRRDSVRGTIKTDLDDWVLSGDPVQLEGMIRQLEAQREK